MKPETMKQLEENIGGKLLDRSCQDDFLTLTPKAKINKWGLYHTKKLLHRKETINRTKR